MEVQLDYKYHSQNDDSCLDLEDADAAQRVEETRHRLQQPQHKICPKCGCEVKVYETGRSLCTRVPCDYEGPGILRASAA